MRRLRTTLVLGHRGFRSRYPENTLLAFRQAIENGADGVECDIQKTADQHYVVIHDPTTDRVTGAAGVVGKMSLGELRRLDFGGGERIPELAELLDAIPRGSYLDLELKAETITADDCRPIADILDVRITRQNLMVSSFAPQLLMPFRRSGFTVGFLVVKRPLPAACGHLRALSFGCGRTTSIFRSSWCRPLARAGPLSSCVVPGSWAFHFSSGP
jgi:glycerophosphoryl diester phosphodiesterase